MTYAAEVLADSPAAYYRLGEAAGATTLVDASGNGHNGSYVGSPTLGVAGALPVDSDTALTVSGTGQYATVPSGTWMDGSAVTFEVWVKRSAGTSQFIGGRNTGASSSSALFVDMNSATALRCYASNAAGSQTIVSATVTMNDGKWHHVVATASSSGVFLYFDGAQVGSGAGLTAGVRNPSTASLDIGRRGGSTSTLWNGSIDEAAWYTTALSSARVAAHYAAAHAAAVGLATSANTAQAIQAARALVVGMAVSSNTARAIAALVPTVVTVNRATGTHTAQHIAVVQPVTVGQPHETDTARPIGVARGVPVGQAIETDTGQTVTPYAPQVVAVGRAGDAETGRPVTANQTQGVGRAGETDTGQTVGIHEERFVPVGRASSSGTARPITVVSAQIVQLAQAAEAEAARALVAVVPQVRTVGQAGEIDAGRLLPLSLTAILGIAEEQDTAEFVGVLTSYELPSEDFDQGAGRTRGGTFTLEVIPVLGAPTADTGPIRVMAHSAPTPTMVGGKPQ